VTESETQKADVQTNRAARKWSKSELLGRLIWDCTQFAFRWSPRQFWLWRRVFLRVFGAQIGNHVHIHPSVRIAVPWNVEIGDYSAIGDGAIIYSLGRVRIAAQATISQYVHLCAGTHDYRDPAMPLEKSSIDIADGVWVCANAFVGPNTRLGAYAIIGAASVAVSDVPAWTIVAGNPARKIKTRPAFKA